MKMITFFYMFLLKKCNWKTGLAANVALYLHTVVWLILGIVLGGFIVFASHNTLDVTSCLLTVGSALGLFVGYLGGLWKLINIIE